MDSTMKTVLAVVAGIVIGATLMGGAVAIPAAFHAFAFRSGVAESGYGMMGERFGPFGGPGMMGRQGYSGVYAPQGGNGVCGNAGPGAADPQGRGQRGPQDGTEVRPDGGACPHASAAPPAES